MNVKLNAPDISFEETFMRHFNTLGLNGQEKSQLSLKHRREMCAYKNVDQRSLKSAIKNLSKRINDDSSSEITIEADDFGSYVCLATIFSGEISTNKMVHFELNNIPLKLMSPQLLSGKINSANITVNINFEHGHWVTSFKTLHALPTGIELDHNIVYKKACA